MLAFFKNKIVSLDWLDIKMSNQFFIEFVNKVEKLDFFKIDEISKITKLESQRDYFSDGSYRTNIDIELVTSNPTMINLDDLGTMILFVNDSAHLFEEAYITNKHIASSHHIDVAEKVTVLVNIRATNYAILNKNQTKVLDTFFQTRKIDTSILTFDSTINFFEK